MLNKLFNKAADSFEDVAAAIARIPDRLADRHFISQGFWLDRICRARLDYVGHLESLAADWPVIGSRIGREVALPRLNSSAAIAFSPPIPLPPGPVALRAEIDAERLWFAYRVGTGAWQRLPQTFDASILSDEAAMPGSPNFTGAFVGMACQDMAGTGAPADFEHFTYRERDFLADPFATA